MNWFFSRLIEPSTWAGVAAFVSQIAPAIQTHNPLSIAVPCHRVVGANGTLTGYAGGLERKRFLLGLEGALDEAELTLF